MKIFVCQTAPKVGAIEENSRIIRQAYVKSQRENSDICVFPELCITGYLAEDLFFKKDFINQAETHAKKLIEETLQTCLLLPTILFENDCLYNVVIAAQNGRTGALLVGSPEEVSEKILGHSAALGGINRFTFQLDNANLSHQQLKNTMQLIAEKVKPIINQE